MTTNYGQQVYAQGPGTASTTLLDAVRLPRDPTPQDVNFPLGKFWVNTIDNDIFYYTSQTSLGGVLQAIWTNLASGTAGTVNTLTGDIGAPVTPVLGNIDVKGQGTGAILFSNNGPGLLGAQVQVDNTSIAINGSDQLSVIGFAVSAVITTNDATPTTIYSQAMGPTPGTSSFDILISAYNITDGTGAGYGMIGAVRTNGITATALSVDDIIYSYDPSMSATNVNITASANNAIVQVIGLAGKTIDWRAQIRYLPVT